MALGVLLGLLRETSRRLSVKQTERGHQDAELWACVGRGAAKSTARYKLATFFSLFGEFVVPPGERHFAIVLSRLKEEASKGVGIISRWLDLLGVPHKLAGDVIELADLPWGIRVVAASVAAASGWRAFFIGKDERSKWPTSEIDDQDGAEVDTSAAAPKKNPPAALSSNNFACRMYVRAARLDRCRRRAHQARVPPDRPVRTETAAEMDGPPQAAPGSRRASRRTPVRPADRLFDMLKEIGVSTKSTAILIPHTPGNLTSLSDQIRTAMIEAEQVKDHGNGVRESA